MALNLKVAIVGSGPGGFYAAESLMEAFRSVLKRYSANAKKAKKPACVYQKPKPKRSGDEVRAGPGNLHRTIGGVSA